MSYYLFFKYMPRDTIANFLQVLGILLVISTLEMTLYPSGALFLALCFRVMAFTIWYPSFLFFFYILKNSENIKIQGISPSCLKPAMRGSFILHLAIASFFILLFTLFLRDYVLVSFCTSLGMLAMSIFYIITLDSYLVAELVHAGEKEHVNIENINAEYLDEATKEVLLKQSTS